MRYVVSTARTMVGTTTTTTTAAGTPRRVAVALPGSNPQAAGVTKMLGSLQPSMAAGARLAGTIQLGAAAAASPVAVARPQLVAANPAALGGSPTVLGGVPTGSSPSSSAANPAFNQMILNALSNRGLLSQQNGKFVYVGATQTKPNNPGNEKV